MWANCVPNIAKACPTCFECKKHGGFQKGLNPNDFDALYESAYNKGDWKEHNYAVNKKDVKNSTLPTFAVDTEPKYCPRCRSLFNRTYGMSQFIPAVNDKNVIAICDICCPKNEFRGPCWQCGKAIEKLKTQKNIRQETSSKYVKEWLKKIQATQSDFRNNIHLKSVVRSDITLGNQWQQPALADMKQAKKFAIHRDSQDILPDYSDANDIFAKPVHKLEYGYKRVPSPNSDADNILLKQQQNLKYGFKRMPSPTIQDNLNTLDGDNNIGANSLKHKAIPMESLPKKFEPHLQEKISLDIPAIKDGNLYFYRKVVNKGKISTLKEDFFKGKNKQAIHDTNIQSPNLPRKHEGKLVSNSPDSKKDKLGQDLKFSKERKVSLNEADKSDKIEDKKKKLNKKSDHDEKISTNAPNFIKELDSKYPKGKKDRLEGVKKISKEENLDEFDKMRLTKTKESKQEKNSKKEKGIFKYDEDADSKELLLFKKKDRKESLKKNNQLKSDGKALDITTDKILQAKELKNAKKEEEGNLKRKKEENARKKEDEYKELRQRKHEEELFANIQKQLQEKQRQQEIETNLVRIENRKKLAQMKTVDLNKILEGHKIYHKDKMSEFCYICQDSDVELEIDRLICKKKMAPEPMKIIIGDQIYLKQNKEKPRVVSPVKVYKYEFPNTVPEIIIEDAENFKPIK